MTVYNYNGTWMFYKQDVPFEVACEPQTYFRSLLLGFFSAGETGAEENRTLSQATFEVAALFDLHYQISQKKR